MRTILKLEMGEKFSFSVFNTEHLMTGLSFSRDKVEAFVWFDRPGESSPERDCCWFH